MQRILSFLLVGLLSSVAHAAGDFVISPGEPNLVVFESKTPLETFQGRTRQVQGRLALDPEALGDSIDVVVEVELASLDTGLEIRNRHMRDNHLHTDRFPKAVFRGGGISGLDRQRLDPGERVSFTIHGTLDLHDVEHGMQAAVTMIYNVDDTGTWLDLIARFEVSLADYDIPRPSFLVMKLNDIQAVKVELVARPRDGARPDPEDSAARSSGH
jgi:polyisoprenoid-binding protein YceI